MPSPARKLFNEGVSNIEGESISIDINQSMLYEAAPNINIQPPPTLKTKITVKALKSIAEDRGFKRYSKLRKAELMTLLCESTLNAGGSLYCSS